jgi:hypothetical protein
MSDLLRLVASEMHVSRRTVQRWCASGRVRGAYRTKGGHWRVRKPRGKIDPDSKIEQLIMRYFIPAARPSSPLTIRGALERLRWIVEWQISDAMEALVKSESFNDALEFSIVAKQCSCDDIRNPMRLKNRDPEKFRYLIGDPRGDMICPNSFFDMVLLGTYKVMKHRNAKLATKAYKLALNGRAITSAALARELNVSMAELYRRYDCTDLQRVKRAGHHSLIDDGIPVKDRFSYTHHPVDDLEPLSD